MNCLTLPGSGIDWVGNGEGQDSVSERQGRRDGVLLGIGIRDGDPVTVLSPTKRLADRAGSYATVASASTAVPVTVMLLATVTVWALISAHPAYAETCPDATNPDLPLGRTGTGLRPPAPLKKQLSP